MLSFVFLVVKMHPYTEYLWHHFFKTCEPGAVEAVVMSPGAEFLPNWAVKITTPHFAYPKKSLRFSKEMVMLMNAGVEAAAPNSTVAFLSDTSIPLVSCGTATSRLLGKNYYFIKKKPPYYKSSQWISLDKTLWTEAYSNLGVPANWSHQCRNRMPGAFDEFLMRERFFRADDRVNQETHAVYWRQRIGDGHPDILDQGELQDAAGRNFLFARKFLPSPNVTFKMSWLDR